jgi:CRISPR-associated protein Cmr5
MARINERLIAEADKALNNPAVEIFKDRDSKTIPSEFNGYISAFGAAIIQSGLLPAMAFYQNAKSQAKSDRGQLINAIAIMSGRTNGKALFKECCDLQHDSAQLEELKKQIIDCAIALKLVIRTYQLD